MIILIKQNNTRSQLNNFKLHSHSYSNSNNFLSGSAFHLNKYKFSTFYTFHRFQFSSAKSNLSEDLKRIVSLVDKEENGSQTHREYAEQLVFLLDKNKVADFEKVVYFI